jgi:hypothetical protein
LIKTIADKIFIVEDYINRDTCDFLAKCFNSNLSETGREGIEGGPSFSKKLMTSGASDGQNYFNYAEDSEYNVGIDMMAGIAERTSVTISDHYQNGYYLKSMFWSKMTEGGHNTLHMDNWYENFDGQLKPRPYNMYDRSGILYLTDNYEGGEIYFPNQDFKIKPKAGTFIFFEGNIDVPHEVLEVTSGVRCNIISFYGDYNSFTLDTNSSQEDYPLKEVQSTVDSLKNIKEIVEEYDRFEQKNSD